MNDESTRTTPANPSAPPGDAPGGARDADPSAGASGASCSPAELELCIVGRPSSHFTRVARLFAEELGLAYQFELVRDLLSRDSAHYGGNPALKLPALKTREATWFGALNICRELARRSERRLR